VFLEPHDPNYKENNEFCLIILPNQGLDFFDKPITVLIKDVYGRDWHAPEEAVRNMTRLADAYY
jgi:hypothetical protein